MNKKRWIALFLAAPIMTLLGVVNTASAQTRVALVDIGKVFKNHPGFTQKLDALRGEAEQFKANAIQLQQQLVQKAEILKEYTPGSAEFKKAEADLASESARLEVEQRNMMRTLMQREAQLHFDTYEQVANLIATYCDERGIQLVLRFSDQPMDPQKPATIMQRVNGSIIFHRPNQDITDQIIALIAQSSQSARSAVPPRR